MIIFSYSRGKKKKKKINQNTVISQGLTNSDLVEFCSVEWYSQTFTLSELPFHIKSFGDKYSCEKYS